MTLANSAASRACDARATARLRYRRSVLYEPLTFRSGAVMPNRLALAPMTNGQSLPDGRLGDDELAWLARRAGVGRRAA